MALSERRILSSVNLRIDIQCIEVCWLDQVLRDDEVISSVPFRRAYDRNSRELFLADLAQYPTAPHAVTAIGWDEPTVLQNGAV